MATAAQTQPRSIFHDGPVFRDRLAAKPATGPASSTRSGPRPEVAAAIAHHAAGRLAEAEAVARRLLLEDPVDDQAMQVLAEVERSRGRITEAVSWLRQAVAVAPKVPEYLSELGRVFDEIGAHALAEKAFREAIDVRPDSAAAHRNLGIFLSKQGRPEEALAAHQEATRLDPRLAESHRDAGDMLKALKRYDEAAAAYRAALAVNPRLMPARWGLLAVLRDQVRLYELMDATRELLRVDPGDATTHSDLIFTLYYDPRQDAKSQFEAAAEWGRRHAAPRYAAIKAHCNDPSPNRRLRIGYISPDFRAHIAGRLVWPILANHDHANFEIYCYSDVKWSDSITHELWKLSDVWRGINGMPDEAVAELIREDEVDILVELTGHFGGNRLAMLGYRPAPVQASHLGYCATTGVETVDYRFTDDYSDPPGETEQYHTERLWRMESLAWCNVPMEPTPDVGPLPADSCGHVTFGCLNVLVKVPDEAVATWSRILAAVPGSRLALLSAGPEDDTFVPMFARHGIPRERLELVRRRPRYEYMDVHNRIDISLDPFPFNGDNTTCDALWMGVPVVSLKGKTFATRRSFSHCSQVGLGELAADTLDAYVETAVSLAKDLDRLRGIRSSLRQRMLASPLCDARGYTRKLEAAYREMWRIWCQTRGKQDGTEAG